MGLFSKKSAPQPSARPEYIEVGQIVNTHGAVSYTHLTLPTMLAQCRSRWSPYH